MFLDGDEHVKNHLKLQSVDRSSIRSNIFMRNLECAVGGIETINIGKSGFGDGVIVLILRVI